MVAVFRCQPGKFLVVFVRVERLPCEPAAVSQGILDRLKGLLGYAGVTKEFLAGMVAEVAQEEFFVSRAFGDEGFHCASVSAWALKSTSLRAFSSVSTSMKRSLE